MRGLPEERCVWNCFPAAKQSGGRECWSRSVLLAGTARCCCCLPVRRCGRERWGAAEREQLGWRSVGQGYSSSSLSMRRVIHSNTPSCGCVSLLGRRRLCYLHLHRGKKKSICTDLLGPSCSGYADKCYWVQRGIWSTASAPTQAEDRCSAEGAAQLERQFCCRWPERLTWSQGKGRNICQWRPSKMMLKWRVRMFRYPLQ